MIHYAIHSNPNVIVPAKMLEDAQLELGIGFDLWCEDKISSDKPHWAFDNYRLGGAIGYECSKLLYTQPSWGKFFADKMGQENVKCITYAVDENVYPEVKAEKIYDIGFIGNLSDGDGREDLFNSLKDKYKVLVSKDTPTNGIAGEYAKCKIILNPIRYEEINIRFFEALACGAQIASYSPALHLFAEEGKHYLTYKTKDELHDKIEYLLKNPDIAETMRVEARKEVLRRHTYKHRVKEIANFI